MDFIGRLDLLLNRGGINDATLSKLLGKKSSLVSNWRSRAKENDSFIPASDLIRGLSEALHAPAGYFYGLCDEYGLENSDWYNIATLIGSWLTAINRDYDWLFSEAGIEDINVDDFTNGLAPLTADQLEKIGEVCRIPDIKTYLPPIYSLKIWPEMQKTAPEIGDGLNDLQLSAVSELKGLTPEETVRAIAYIQGLRDNRAKQ